MKAADLARRTRSPDQLARAALGYGGRFVWTRAWGDTHLVPLLEEALRAPPVPHSAAEAKDIVFVDDPQHPVAVRARPR